VKEPADPAAAPNVNRFWADLIVEEMLRCGVGLFCLSPGSRSTPLATAVFAHPRVRHLMHYDERGTAFAALGWARATGRPACWVTTSGTAVANGLPAIVEANVDGVPLIALTADRPPELRHTAANQTIDQPDIFGGQTRWRFDVPAPTPDVDPAFVLTTVDQAVHRALHPRGPVHLNAMFREPLAPDPDGRPLPDAPSRWRQSTDPYTRYEAPAGIDPGFAARLAEQLAGVERGVVVAGRLRTRQEGEAVARLADGLGWPLIADVQSQLRQRDGVITHADLVVASGAFAAAQRPAFVIHLGGPVVSKRLAQFVRASVREAGAQARFVVVRADAVRADADHLVTDRIQAEVSSFCDAVAAALAPRAATGWRRAWRVASDAVAARLAAELDVRPDITEPGVARAVWQALPAGQSLVVASSMPVRDVDAFASGGPGGPVFANRGASGIDGTVATAAGVARGCDAPVTLLIGDLAMLHDLNSLALLRDADQPPVTIVVVNNDGGGIFSFLPIARHEEVFEPLFGTPHGMDFAGAATQFGLPYRLAETAAELASVLKTAASGGRSSIVEVRTERVANRALHAELLEAAADAMRASGEPRAEPAVTA
jgi:2-succinyl-5-enolpyruvyl-6-hydroxy-3-cyclohexene-1-carboxylate synthase